VKRLILQFTSPTATSFLLGRLSGECPGTEFYRYPSNSS